MEYLGLGLGTEKQKLRPFDTAFGHHLYSLDIHLVIEAIHVYCGRSQ